MKYIYLLIILIGSIKGSSQTTEGFVINGKILSTETNTALQGATIVLKQQQTTARAGRNGAFTIFSRIGNDTLIVSHVGHLTKELVFNQSSKSPLIIILQEKQNLLKEIVVNTGFQSLPRERSTGAITQIDNKLYNEQAGTDILERLKYISNGIVPVSQRIANQASGQMLIRGFSTLTMSIQKPLIILDNFEYQGDILNINPNDIENVTFLKDAASGSIWGAKAANGVIVLTTKKGKFNQKTKVEFSSNVSISEKPNLFALPNMTSTDLIDIESYLFSQKHNFTDTASDTHPNFSPVYEILFKKQSGQIPADEADAQINLLRSSDMRNDFNKYIYQKAVNQQYSINLTGGSNNISWRLSAGNDRNVSEIDAKYTRNTFSLNQTYKPVRDLSINTALFYTQSKATIGRPDYGSIGTSTGVLPVYTRLADDNGNALALYNQYRQTYIDTVGRGKLLDWRYYPLDDYKYQNNNTRIQDINAVVGINYMVLPGLNIDVKYRYEKQRTDNDNLFGQQSYYARNLINNFSQIDGSTGTVSYPVPVGDILDIGTSSTTAQNLRAQVNFDKTYNNHSISFLAGTEFSETVHKGNIYRNYGYNAEILTAVNVDYANSYPLMIGGTGYIESGRNFTQTNTRFASFYLNGAYTFSGRYTASGSIRRDASNLFGVDINDKWKPLWSTGLSWDISKENFYKLDFLPSLKMRLTYGHQGNLDPGKVGVTTLVYQSVNSYTSTPFGAVQNYVNPDLKWEQVGMLNLGIDFSSKNNRVSGSLAYYKKNIQDLYGESIVDGTLGIGNSIVKNVGELRGHGIDLELSSLNINRGLKWNTNFIFNSYNDKVIKWYLPATASQYVGNSIGIEGYPSLSLLTYKWAGLDPKTGDPQGYLNGQISKNWSAITGTEGTINDIAFNGSRIPTVFGSLGNTFSYKNFSLTLRLTYKFNYYFLRPSINYSSLVNNLSGHSDYALRWQTSGDEQKTDIPSFIYPTSVARDNFYFNSATLVTKGDHIRLQYINFSYDLNKTFLKKLPFQQAQFYVLINNVGLIWRANKYELDPDYAAIPPSKNIVFGLRINL